MRDQSSKNGSIMKTVVFLLNIDQRISLTSCDRYFVDIINTLHIFQGNLMVWNIQNDDLEDLIAVKNVHDEFVTQISWIHDLDKNVTLATSSTDGFLKLWCFSLSKQLSLKVW